MPSASPGHFWKTPFVFEFNGSLPAASNRLRYETLDEAWLRVALRETLARSLSESDQYLIRRVGLALVAEELLSAAQQHFVRPPSWWRMARDLDGNAVGFVLPVLFKEPEPDPHGLARPEGTIFHLGVLPKFRGHGFALDLIAEATRICSSAGCWRVFCDTSSNNSPMLDAFRQAGYSELMPWQRPLA
jgi:ribosomal protein S18 acetylase RimI-like enzyme